MNLVYDKDGIKLYHDDCRDVIDNLPDCDLLLTDPPYGDIINEHWDKIDNYQEFTKSWFPKIRLTSNGQALIFCSIGRKSDSLLTIACELKRKMIFQDMIVWKKQRGRGNRKGYLFCREEILWATVNETEYTWNKDAQYSTDKYHDSWIKRLKKEDKPFKRLTNVFTDVEESTIEQARLSGGRGKRLSLHPTQKPLALIERLLKCHSEKSSIVLDPFAGSGTTLVAAKRLGINAIGIEKDQRYIATIIDRLNY